MWIVVIFCSFSRNNLKFYKLALKFLKICINYEHNSCPQAVLSYSGKQSKVHRCVTNAAAAEKLPISSMKAGFKFTWLDIKSIHVRIRRILWSCLKHQWVHCRRMWGEKQGMNALVLHWLVLSPWELLHVHWVSAQRLSFLGLLVLIIGIIPENFCLRELQKFHNNSTHSSYYQIPPTYKKCRKGNNLFFIHVRLSVNGKFLRLQVNLQ